MSNEINFILFVRDKCSIHYVMGLRYEINVPVIEENYIQYMTRKEGKYVLQLMKQFFFI
jgi:hypothetical protein